MRPGEWEHKSSAAGAFHGCWAPQAARCLPACPPPLHREHPGSSLPHLVLLQLCCFSVTETFLAFYSQVSFYFCLTFIPYRASVSDFLRLAFCFKTQLYLKNSLLFCILLLLAAFLLFWCLQQSAFLLPFPWLPFVSLQADSFCCIFSATVLRAVAFWSHRQWARLYSAVGWLEHPERQKPAPFYSGIKRGLCASLCFPKSKTLLGNSCVEILLIMWRHKINLTSASSVNVSPG